MALNKNSKTKPLLSRKSLKPDPVKEGGGGVIKTQPSKSNVLPLKLVNSGQRQTDRGKQVEKSLSKPKLSGSSSSKALPAGRLTEARKEISKSPGNLTSRKARISKQSQDEDDFRLVRNGKSSDVKSNKRIATVKGRVSPRSSKDPRLRSLERSLEQVSEELRGTVEMKKGSVKKQFTETTQDFSSSIKGNDSILSRISTIGLDKDMKKRLDRYKSMKLDDKIQLQSELIGSLVGILKEENTKRMACEQEFESILIKDSKKIEELVIPINPGSPSRVLAEIKAA